MSIASWSVFTIQFTTAFLCENVHHHADIRALHSGQLPPLSATRRAQFSQNLAESCVYVPGTNAAADALAAVGVNCSSSSSSSSSLELSACWLGCIARRREHQRLSSQHARTAGFQP